MGGRCSTAACRELLHPLGRGCRRTDGQPSTQRQAGHPGTSPGAGRVCLLVSRDTLQGSCGGDRRRARRPVGLEGPMDRRVKHRCDAKGLGKPEGGFGLCANCL